MKVLTDSLFDEIFLLFAIVGKNILVVVEKLAEMIQFALITEQTWLNLLNDLFSLN